MGPPTYARRACNYIFHGGQTLKLDEMAILHGRPLPIPGQKFS